MKRGYCSILSLKDQVYERIESGDLDSPLKLLSNFVEQVITEPLLTAQIFGSKTLDGLCQSIGNISLANIKDEIEDVVFSDKERYCFIYVVTKLQQSGGHTRVIEDFIKARSDARHVILSTELIGRSDVDYVNLVFGGKSNVSFEWAPKTNFQKKLEWLQKRLLEIHPVKLYLFNHHQDSVAVAAIQPEMKFDASFYHHGDHHLCLGVYLTHLEHIDFHPMGYHNCRDELGINNTYMPLTAQDKGVRPADWGFFDGGVLTTCTAAKSNKIEIPYFVSYLNLIPKLLQITGGRHVHIGRLTPWALFKIRRGLRHHGIQSDQFIYIPWVPSVWKTLHDYRVDLYVASFPYGGGLTLIEAMGAGVPVVLHRHIFSRVLGCLELAYPGAFSWRYPDELLNYCSVVGIEDLKKASHLGRAHYEEYHAEKCLQDVLSLAAHNSPVPASLSDEFYVEKDEWAFWVERQLTIRRIMLRTIYRLFRRLRALF